MQTFIKRLINQADDEIFMTKGIYAAGLFLAGVFGFWLMLVIAMILWPTAH